MSKNAHFRGRQFPNIAFWTGHFIFLSLSSERTHIEVQVAEPIL